MGIVSERIACEPLNISLKALLHRFAQNWTLFQSVVSVRNG